MPSRANSVLPSICNAPSEAFYRSDNYTVDDSVSYLMRLALASISRQIDLQMQEYGVTALQWGPLLLIKHGRGNTAAALARESSIDTGAVTRMLDRLEAKGLLTRERCKRDRRVVHLKLTAEGERVTEHIPACVSSVLNSHLRGFSVEQFEFLKGLLRQMLENGKQPA